VTYLTGDGAVTFTAMGDAYSLVAAELAKRDPKTVDAPVFFGDTKTK
jgi:hypothetical protein